MSEINNQMNRRLKLARANDNYNYFVDYIKSKKSVLGQGSTFSVLDYGCGRGYIMRLLGEADNDINVYGVDNHIPIDLRDDFLFTTGKIIEIKQDNVLPFDDNQFDLVISNMVFEHVKNKRSAFSEISRVLKNDGMMLHHIPTKDIIMEGHVKIPFYHWFSKGLFRDINTYVMLSLGFGNKKKTFGNKINWIKNRNNLMDSDYIFYEKSKYFNHFFQSQFLIKEREIDYIEYRVQRSNNKLAKMLISIKCLKPLYVLIFRRLCFHAYELKQDQNA